ncbi:MAG: hypothetical protein ACREK6_15375 [Candidatus Rokuibacteriota bacterium]
MNACPSRARQPSPESSHTVFPAQLRVGDRYTDDDGEWEVVEGPSTRTGGKAVWTRVRHPGRPETEREMIWAAHERIAVRRA